MRRTGRARCRRCPVRRRAAQTDQPEIRAVLLASLCRRLNAGSAPVGGGWDSGPTRRGYYRSKVAALEAGDPIILPAFYIPRRYAPELRGYHGHIRLAPDGSINACEAPSAVPSA